MWETERFTCRRAYIFIKSELKRHTYLRRNEVIKELLVSAIFVRSIVDKELSPHNTYLPISIDVGCLARICKSIAKNVYMATLRPHYDFEMQHRTKPQRVLQQYTRQPASLGLVGGSLRCRSRWKCPERPILSPRSRFTTRFNLPALLNNSVSRRELSSYKTGRQNEGIIRFYKYERCMRTPNVGLRLLILL
jgi:hypothetical protein